MSNLITIRGRGLVKGIGKGTAVVTKEAISFLGGVDSRKGVVIERGHQLEGVNIAGKVLVFPYGKGSTVGSYVIYSKAIAVDDDINAGDPSDVEYAMATRFQADKGLVVVPHARGSSLDPSADQINVITTKMGIDATASLLKPKVNFERIRIPGEDKIKLEDYVE